MTVMKKIEKTNYVAVSRVIFHFIIIRMRLLHLTREINWMNIYVYKEL